LLFERPSSTGGYIAIVSLLAMLALGALALSWPWISTEVPRAIVTGLGVVRAAVASWIEQAAAWLPRPG